MTFDGLGLIDVLDASVRKYRENPLEEALSRLTVPQREFLSATEPLVAWVDGNQLGKSWALALDCASFVCGMHPGDQTHEPPVEYILTSESWTQFDPLLEKLFTLLPAAWVDPKVGYSKGKGLRGSKEMVIPIVAGRGKGSLIRLMTYKQGTTRVAGSTVHRIGSDEPMHDHIFGELRPRLNRHNGHWRGVFTPTPETAERVTWAREKVDAYLEGKPGGMKRLNFGLKPQNVIIHGGLVPVQLISDEAIDSFIADMLPIEREMRVNGAWSPLVMDRLLRGFSKERCVRRFSLADGRYGPPAGAKLLVGMDHGANRNKQAMSLIAVLQTSPTEPPKVWKVDEWVYEEWTTAEQVAHDILEMLRRNGAEYDDVDEWVGDRPTGTNKWGNSIDNKEIRHQLARILKRPVWERRERMGIKWIHNPVKSSGSAWHGFRLMNAIMLRGDEERSHYTVNAHCEHTIAAHMGFNGDPRNVHKDVLDSERYPIERAVSTREWMRAQLVLG